MSKLSMGPYAPARRLAALLVLLGCIVFAGLLAPDARAEYGDVVINNYSDAAGMRPVVFPHWFHRIRYRCKVCHADLGFKFKAGGNEINMVKVIDGQFCGACHNGEVAWSIENCNMCHSAKPGTTTQVHESTTNSLVGPAAPAAPGAAPAAAPAGGKK
jgi:c(7)-type cytochrome triheme protein